MDNGWICLHRKIIKWEWYQDTNTFKLFIHLLLIANHDNGRWKGQEIMRGQVVTGLRKLSKNTGLSMQQTRTALIKLKSTHEITHESTNKYSLITIVKYEDYQSMLKKSTHKATHRITNEQHTKNEKSTTNNNNNTTTINNNINNKDIYIVVQMLNEICKTNYKATTDKTKRLIELRLKEGFTIEDFKIVIEKKYKEWGNDVKMSKFLRPETLFGTKFESYLNQLEIKQLGTEKTSKNWQIAQEMIEEIEEQEKNG